MVKPQPPQGQDNNSELAKRFGFDIVFDKSGRGTIAASSGSSGLPASSFINQISNPTTQTPVSESSLNSYKVTLSPNSGSSAASAASTVKAKGGKRKRRSLKKRKKEKKKNR